MNYYNYFIMCKKLQSLLEKAHLKNTHIWGAVLTGGGQPNPNLLNRFSQVTVINCPNSKIKFLLKIRERCNKKKYFFVNQRFTLA